MPAKLPSADLEFELLYPENLVFQTYFPLTMGGHPVAAAAPKGPDDKADLIDAPRQLSFSDAHSSAEQISSYPPFSVHWHLDGPSRLEDVPSRNLRLPKHADSFDQAYIKDQPVEVFFSSNATGDHGEAGLWCLGVIKENYAFDSEEIVVRHSVAPHRFSCVQSVFSFLKTTRDKLPSISLT